MFRSMTLPERADWETEVRITFPHMRFRWIEDGGPAGGDDTYDNVYWALRHNVDVTVQADGYLTWWSQATGYWFEMSETYRFHTLPAAQFVTEVKALIISSDAMLWPYGDAMGEQPDPWPTAAPPPAPSLAATRVPGPVFKMPPEPGVGDLHVVGRLPKQPRHGA